MKLTVFTKAYQPFVMGGKTNYHIGTELEVGDPVSLGDNIQGHLVTSPDGKTFVAEASTGAFVGTDLETVKKDLAAADPEIVKQQLADAKQVDIKIVSKEKFWNSFK
jgi:hypothetical protein